MKLYTKEAALDQIAELLGLDAGYSTEDVVQMAWNAWARGVHSCSDNCTRPLCVSRKEVERLTELAEKWAIDARNASERADAAEARVKELESHLASERITRDAVIQQGLELEARVHACAFNRAMNGECFVCGSVDAEIAAAQREADERHAARQQRGAK